MKRVAALALMATPAMAELSCTLQDTTCQTDCVQTTVAFEIDPAQFVAPQNPDDPPRRQVTTVTLNGTTFRAEAILMAGGVQGFHEDKGTLGSRLMIVQSDGAARLTQRPQNITLSGMCSRD